MRSDSTRLDLGLHVGYATAAVTLVNKYGQPRDTETTAYVQV